MSKLNILANTDPLSKSPLKKFTLELDIECNPDELNSLIGVMVGGVIESVSKYSADSGEICTIGNFRIPK